MHQDTGIKWTITKQKPTKSLSKVVIWFNLFWYIVAMIYKSHLIQFIWEYTLLKNIEGNTW